MLLIKVGAKPIKLSKKSLITMTKDVYDALRTHLKVIQKAIKERPHSDAELVDVEEGMKISIDKMRLILHNLRRGK